MPPALAPQTSLQTPTIVPTTKASRAKAPVMKASLPLMDLLRRMSPSAICDHCVADRFELDSHISAASLVARTNAIHNFGRFKGACNICGMNWLVSRLNPST